MIDRPCDDDDDDDRGADAVDATDGRAKFERMLVDLTLVCWLRLTRHRLCRVLVATAVQCIAVAVSAATVLILVLPGLDSRCTLNAHRNHTILS